MDSVKAESAIRSLLEALDQDVTRDGLRDTPKRVAAMFIEQCGSEDAGLDRMFEEKSEDMLMMRDIPVMSFCEHHILPWFGRAHIAYIPRKSRVLGLSKFARLVYSCCKGFTIQEAVTRMIADRLEDEVEPRGCMVVIEAVHSCMNLRGARSIGASTTTSAVRGVFRDVPAARQEFLTLILKGGPR